MMRNEVRPTNASAVGSAAGHAPATWRHPAFGDGNHWPTPLQVIPPNTAASLPVFRLLGVGRGSVTPASPRREASLFTCPWPLAGGILLLFCHAAITLEHDDLQRARICFALLVPHCSRQSQRLKHVAIQMTRIVRRMQRESHRIVITPERPAD